MIERIDHIGIAVRSIDVALPLFRDVFGLTYTGEEVVGDEGVRVAFLQAGEVAIELLEPLAPDTPVGRFLDRRGEEHNPFGAPGPRSAWLHPNGRRPQKPAR